MKNLLFAFALLFFSAKSFAQTDTLTVPVGKYSHIKIGDKVYKILYSIELKDSDSNNEWPYRPIPPLNIKDLDRRFNSGGALLWRIDSSSIKIAEKADEGLKQLKNK